MSTYQQQYEPGSQCPPPKTELRKTTCSQIPIGSGAASHHLMVLKYTLYSWQCVSTIICASQMVPTLENETTKNQVPIGSGAAGISLMVLKYTLYSLECASTII